MGQEPHQVGASSARVMFSSVVSVQSNTTYLKVGSSQSRSSHAARNWPLTVCTKATKSENSDLATQKNRETWWLWGKKSWIASCKQRRGTLMTYWRGTGTQYYPLFWFWPSLSLATIVHCHPLLPLPSATSRLIDIRWSYYKEVLVLALVFHRTKQRRGLWYHVDTSF